jgi:hypothetical protein
LKSVVGNKEKEIATAFFYHHKDGLYLVTNKHVIYGDNFENETTPIVDSVKIYLHDNPKDLSSIQEVIVRLFNDGKKIWLEHKYLDVDVVLIPVTIDRTKLLITSINKDFIECDNIVVDDFETIFLLGYPHGWYDDFNNLPIARIGHLASSFKAPFKGKPVMLGDMMTHKGMSGAPVFMQLKDFISVDSNGQEMPNYGKARRILVGIYSGQFPIPEIPKERTNLINIWFPEMILEILDANGL